MLKLKSVWEGTRELKNDNFDTKSNFKKNLLKQVKDYQKMTKKVKKTQEDIRLQQLYLERDRENYLARKEMQRKAEEKLLRKKTLSRKIY